MKPTPKMVRDREMTLLRVKRELEANRVRQSKEQDRRWTWIRENK